MRGCCAFPCWLPMPCQTPAQAADKHAHASINSEKSHPYPCIRARIRVSAYPYAGFEADKDLAVLRIVPRAGERLELNPITVGTSQNLQVRARAARKGEGQPHARGGLVMRSDVRFALRASGKRAALDAVFRQRRCLLRWIYLACAAAAE